MIKFRKEEGSCRSMLRLRALREVTQTDLWSGMDSEEVSRIVQVLEDTPEELYHALKEARSSGALRKKFQRMAIKTEPQQTTSSCNLVRCQLEALRRRISQKKNQFEWHKQQLGRNRLRPLVTTMFPAGFLVKDSCPVDEMLNRKLRRSRKVGRPLVRC